MKQIRQGLFETNSSASHSITLYYGDTPIFESIICDSDLEDDKDGINWRFDDENVEVLIKSLPIEILEKEIERRKKK